MAATMIEIEKTIMAAAGTATVTLSASPLNSIAVTLVEGVETTTGPAVALEVITAAVAEANTEVAAVTEAIIVAAAVAVAIIVVEVAVATTAELVATTVVVVATIAVAEVILVAAEALEVTSVTVADAEISVAAVVVEISVAAVVVEISVALVVAATLAEVEETSKEAEVTSMGVVVTSEAAEETSGVAVVAASVVALAASSATMTTSTLVTEEADLPILSKDRKDTTIKIAKADHSKNTATDPGTITTGKTTTTGGSREAVCAVAVEEAHVEATLAGHPETEAVCMATSHPAAARTMTTTIASLQKSSKAVACAAEETCV